MYLAVLSLLAVETQPLRAYLYLVAYNVLFVLPLIAIVVLASSRRSLARLAGWQREHHERVRLAIGSSVVALGLGLLIVL